MGVIYLMIDTYYYFIIPMDKWSYSFIHYSIPQETYLYQLNCFLMASRV